MVIIAHFHRKVHTIRVNSQNIFILKKTHGNVRIVREFYGIVYYAVTMLSAV